MPEDLRTLRNRKGMSVNQLARKTGIALTTLIQYEKGAQSIPPDDLQRLAKALYVSEWDVNPRSTPPPPPPPEKEEKREKKEKTPRKAKEKKPPPKSPPARDTQIAHLLTLASKFGEDRAALEEEIGKSLDDLTQKEARHWNGVYMRRLAEEKPKPATDRKRAYLPEGVDEFEMNYLQEQQEAETRLHFTLFDGQTFEGTVVGFSPYQIIIREPGGDEVTLNKLAIAYYRKGEAAGGTGGGA